jgi:hypothetical protein
MTAPAGGPAPQLRVQPLDPNSPKGREVAERLGNVLAELELEIAQREIAEQAAAGRAA